MYGGGRCILCQPAVGLEGGVIVDGRKAFSLPNSCYAHKKKCLKNTVEPGYNDIGLCDFSSFGSDILW